MKRLLLALAILLLPAQAFASSCVISEYSISLRGGAQIAKAKPLKTPQNITVTATSAQSAALSGDTKMVRLWCDTQSAFEQGSNPTASATVSTPQSAGVPEYFDVGDLTVDGNLIAFILRP